MIELKPCPFCGAQMEFSAETEYSTESVYHAVDAKPCALRPFAFDVEEWNTRAEPTGGEQDD